MFTALVCLALLCHTAYGQGSCSASNPEKAPQKFTESQLEKFGDDCNAVGSDPGALTLCLGTNEGKTFCPCTCEKVEDGNYQGSGSGGGGSGNGGNGDSETTAATTPASETTKGPAPAPPPGDCFHRESKAQTDQGPMTMEELSHHKDVKVQAIDSNNKLIMSAVRLWAHADHDRSTHYLKFSTESGHEIEMSDHHLIYTSKCDRVTRVTKFASDVRLGDCLLVQNGESLVPSKVVDVERNTRLGLYAPITEEGSIVVDNVAASCYASSNEYLAHGVVSTLYNIWDWLPSQVIEGPMPLIIEYLLEFVGKQSLFLKLQFMYLEFLREQLK